MRSWVEGLGVSMSKEMHKDGKLIFCMLQEGCFSFVRVSLLVSKQKKEPGPAIFDA